MRVTVARVGRPHGIKGEVAVEVRTDDPDLRFRRGSWLTTEPASVGPLRVEATRWHSGRLLLTFDGIVDRSAAELLRGIHLMAEVPDDEIAGDEDDFFDHQLVGLTAMHADGTRLGLVRDVIHLPGQDVLVVERPAEDASGTRDVLVPFVAAIVPIVDLGRGVLVVDPPPGLLDLSLAEDG